MRRSYFLARACALFLALVVASAAPAGAAPVRKPAEPERTDYLPNDYVLARVGDRVTTVLDYRGRWHRSDPNFRPKPDSLGRVQFLQTLINKDVLGLTALKAGYTLGFEDRAEFRSFETQTLSNILFYRTVTQNSSITDDSVLTVARYYQRDLRVRLLHFPHREEAEFERIKLTTGRETWSVAARKYAVQDDSLKDGETPWLRFDKLPLEVALKIWPLHVGQVTPVVTASAEYFVAQVAEERVSPNPVEAAAAARVMRIQLRNLEMSQRRSAIYDQAKVGMELKYDSTAIQWAADQFKASRTVTSTRQFGMHLTIDPNPPEISPGDTSRVLATWKDGRTLTMGGLLEEFLGMIPVTRPDLSTPEALADFVDSTILAPRLLEMAIARGLEKDTLVTQALDAKREELFVTRMVEDSAFKQVRITNAERQQYYKDHPQDFQTYPAVRFVSMQRTSKGAADSLARTIKTNDDAFAALARDKAAGVPGSDTLRVQDNEVYTYHKIVFEELRPGQTSVVGPDSFGKYAVLHLLEFIPSRTVPFAQIQGSIDESLRNIKAQAALEALAARLAKRYHVESHPELVMRVHLTDPLNEKPY